ncbi:MAG: heme-copper oxidase subunit III [Phenylobacterium sp.]
MSRRVPGDLSQVPTAGMGSHSLWFWAGVGFMSIESAGFALAYATYLYLMNSAHQWPLDGKAPDLLWGTLQTMVLLASIPPTLILMRAAKRRDKSQTQRWGVVVALMNAAALVIRGFEFPHLNAHWDVDAYGSVVWALLLLHTVHLVTDFIDTGVLTIWLFTHPVDTERFADVDDDGIYWLFVIATWLPIYLLVYWAPRLTP